MLAWKPPDAIRQKATQAGQALLAATATPVDPVFEAISSYLSLKNLIYREQWENRWQEMENRVWCVMLRHGEEPLQVWRLCHILLQALVMLRRGEKPLLVWWSRRLCHVLVQARLQQLLVVGAGELWDIFWLCHIVLMQSGHRHFNESQSGNVRSIMSDPTLRKRQIVWSIHYQCFHNSTMSEEWDVIASTQCLLCKVRLCTRAEKHKKGMIEHNRFAYDSLIPWSWLVGLEAGTCGIFGILIWGLEG